MRIGEVIIGASIGVAILMVVGAALFVRNLGDDAPSGFRQTESISQEFAAGPAPRVVVESWRGPVTIRAAAGDTITVDIVRTGSGQSEQEAFDNLTLLEARAQEQDGTVTVRTFRTGGAPAPPGTRAAIVITAPARTSVMVVATGNEGVTIDGITGPIDVTADAVIHLDVAAGASFELAAQTQTGAINDAIGLQGELVRNGTGQALDASLGTNGPRIVLRAGTGITLRR